MTNNSSTKPLCSLCIAINTLVADIRDSQCMCLNKLSVSLCLSQSLSLFLSLCLCVFAMLCHALKDAFIIVAWRIAKLWRLGSGMECC